MISQEAQVTLQTKRNFRRYTTLLEIVQKRGYFVDQDQKFDSLKEFQSKISQIQRQVFFKQGENENQEKKVLGIYCNWDGEEINQAVITRYLDRNRTIPFDTIIFVAPVSKKSGVADYDKGFHQKFSEQTSIRIQIFKQDDLLFNVLNHDLVPEHIILTDQQKQQVLKYYKVKQSQLPKILVSDPVARFLGLRKGQVVKICRKSQTAGQYTTYRVAI